VGDEPWNNPTYLDDPGQFARLRETVERLRHQGLCVWLYDELGYPSCSAGGRVLEGHPEFQVEVIGCRTFAARPDRRSTSCPNTNAWKRAWHCLSETGKSRSQIRLT